METSEFSHVVSEIRAAIEEGVTPTLISQGSSGSYFCKDRQGVNIGVFKPKNEEPYGELNPKWAKWVHRTFFPCCFGRSCLIPNSGYLSEAAASTVDQALGLHIVPHTEVVELASPSFSYTSRQRRMAKKGRLPLKKGSLQLFVNGFKDAELVIGTLEDLALPEAAKISFRRQFERLVILDYIIRNTDRGNQNWLIKVTKGITSTPSATSIKIATTTAAGEQSGGNSEGKAAQEDSISLAAIDHGLAFPLKHPDNWRNYPFGWSLLPAARVAFSDETVGEFLPKLENVDFVDNLISQIRDIYKLDSRFSEDLFNKQMGVLRGQVFNLVDCLKKRHSPAQLVEMEPMVIAQVVEKKGLRRWIFNHRKQSPFFKSC